jgi:hypothetical protein
MKRITFIALLVLGILSVVYWLFKPTEESGQLFEPLDSAQAKQGEESRWGHSVMLYVDIEKADGVIP